MASTLASGSQCIFPEIIGANERRGQWAMANRRELAGPPRELYIGRLAVGGAERFEIAWPIE